MSASTDSGRPMRAALRLAVVAALLLPAAAAAQSTLGTIRGTVTDPQKQVVAGAAVLITDEDTGVPRVADTDGSGNYEVPNLRAGNYRVEINAPSLKAYRGERRPARRRDAPRRRGAHARGRDRRGHGDRRARARFSAKARP